MRARFQRWYSEVPYPKTLPAYSDLVVDAEGNLWLGDYHELGMTQPHWTVFDPSGKLLGDVEVPAGVTIHEIGADYILGKVLDELDVESVALYRVIKPERT